MFEKLSNMIERGNSLGIPLPMVRDPKTGKGSVSLTLVFFSFNLVFAGLIGKITNFLGNVDMTNALWLFGISTSLYFGRNLKGNPKQSEFDNQTTEKESNESK